MDEPPSRRIKSAKDEWHLMAPDAGISLIYFPFLANEKVPGVDPMKSDFMSTWNFIYTPEEIESVKQVFNQLRAGQFPNQHENDWLTRKGERRRDPPNFVTINQCVQNILIILRLEW